jgi:hypothetical protein
MEFENKLESLIDLKKSIDQDIKKIAEIIKNKNNDNEKIKSAEIIINFNSDILAKHMLELKQLENNEKIENEMKKKNENELAMIYKILNNTKSFELFAKIMLTGHYRIICHL